MEKLLTSKFYYRCKWIPVNGKVAHKPSSVADVNGILTSEKVAHEQVLLQM